MANNHVIDRLLVARAQSGEEAAFTFLVRRWNPKLVGFCYKLSGNADAARDIAQETWVAVVRGLKKLDDPARFRGWLYRIATNKAADHIRALQRNRRKENEMGQMAAITETRNDGPEEGLALKTLIDRLAPERKALLILFYVEGLSLAELAEVFEAPTGTIKSRLHSAREDLKFSFERKAS